jgi:hypothetical protein
MKKKMQKLQLRKKTISHLNEQLLKNIHGGITPTVALFCFSGKAQTCKASVCFGVCIPG